TTAACCPNPDDTTSKDANKPWKPRALHSSTTIGLRVPIRIGYAAQPTRAITVARQMRASTTVSCERVRSRMVAQRIWGKWKPSRDYYYEFTLWCPKCEIASHVESARRSLQQTQILL